VRNTSNLSAASADTWSQYDSEHPDSPDARMRSLSPSGPNYPGGGEGESEMRFIYATPGDGRPQTVQRKKRKADDASSDESVEHEPEDGKGALREEKTDGKRKFKKMMNVRHYRAQTKDALQSLRDVLPESIRPLERQARSFTVVNGVYLFIFVPDILITALTWRRT
jgi:hypothetical protein